MNEIVWDAFDEEIEREPALTATLYRTWPTHTETMWAHGYPHIRLIVLTFPAVRLGGTELSGVVRELPVGWRDMATPETFRTRFEKYVQDYVEMDWVRQGATEVAR